MKASSAGRAPRFDPPLVVSLALILALPAACWIPIPGLSAVRSMQAGYVVACAGWLFLLYRGSGSRGGSLFRRDTAPPLAAILGVAIVARVLLLPLPPSDDVYRYAWEGLVRVEGFNPYVVAPNDDAIAYLRPDWWGQINHPYHAAIYPPLAQCVFAALAWLSPSPIMFKVFMLLAELGAIGLLLMALRRCGLPLGGVGAYALSPLALLAISREGHLDALIVLGLAMMLAFTVGNERLSMRDALLAGTGLGLAIGAKWVAIVLAPWLAWRVLRPLGLTQGARLLGSVLVAVFLLCAPAVFYLDHGWRAIIDPLRNFSTEFHNLDYARQWLVDVAPTGFVPAVSIAIVGVVSLGIALARRSVATAICWTFGTVIVLSPTVHPWYLVWVIPALCLRFSLPWVVLALTMVLAYEGDHQLEITGAWSQPAWVAPAVWMPFLIALLLVSVHSGATLFSRRSLRVQ